MKHMIRFIFVMLTAYFYFGCAKVAFQASPSSQCVNFNSALGSQSCVMTPDGLNQYKYSVRVGEVEILFVNDNSASMYVEQQKIANQFPAFLDSIKDLDYRIAMITTDVSASPNNSAGAKNGNGSLWDGKFISFPGGKSFLSNPAFSNSVHNSNITAFQNTIQRPETLNCDSNGGCPSSDERGIYALNMALDRSENSSFFRAGGHLAVVILSDEDERSVAPGEPSAIINRPLNQGLYDLAEYKLKNYDLPLTFVEKFNQHMDSTKSLSVHSIIIKPKAVKNPDGSVSMTTGDAQGDACKNAQNAQVNGQGQAVKGFYGTQYAALSVPSDSMKAAGNIVEGEMGDICANNYTQQLGPIADKITGLNFVQLPCEPVLSTVDIKFSPAPNAAITFDIDPSNASRIIFTPNVPPGTDVLLDFKCPR